MQVTKTFTFHAAHRDALADDQCGRLHGHTYRLELHVSGEIQHDAPRRDMLVHGDLLKVIYRERVEPYVEHQHLNETLTVNPTMENVAQWCQGRIIDGLLHHLGPTHRLGVRVTLWETPTMSCTFP